MRVVVLGSGTSTGVPVIGCTCAVCQDKRPGNQRFRASIAIISDSGFTVVVDTAPEFRLQLLRENIQRLDAVLYTHMHADHTHGFDDLRAFYFHHKQPVKCYVAADVIPEFKSRFAYAFEDTGYLGAKPQVDLETTPEKPFMLGDLNIEPITLPHGHVSVVGFKIGRFAYVTDFKTFSPAQIAAWKGKIDVMIASGIHFGTHATHSTIPETLALFKQLGVRQGYLTHLAHDVEYYGDAARLPADVAFAYDGLSLTI